MDATHKLELVPLDEPGTPEPVDHVLAEIEIVPMGATVVDNTVSPGSADRFLKEAKQQYEEGHVDHPLWERALAQAGNDKTAATQTYLRARATALRLLDRDRRARRTGAAGEQPRLGGDTVTPGARTPESSERAPLSEKFARHRKAMIAAAALVPVGFGVWLLSVYLGNSSTSDASIARPVPAKAQTAARGQAPAAATATAGDKRTRRGTTPDFMNKIQQLNDAGNWNVLVLYAVEWTRLEPANAAAWDQLRAGYVNLRQYRDAFDAASKAVQLAPEDSRMWRNLGLINVDLNAPGEALNAFDKALAVNPDDATARCLRMAVAHLSVAQKEAKAPTKQPGSFDTCRGLIEPVAAR